MALTRLERDTVQKACTAAKQLLIIIKPQLDQINVLFYGNGNESVTIDAAALASDSINLSGLTKAQLDDGMYALCAVTKGGIDNAFTALAELAARS